MSTRDAGDLGGAIAHADRDYPALFQLFGGYFHQDWNLEYASWHEAVSAFREEAPAHLREDAVTEVARLIATGYDNAALERMLYPGLGCYLEVSSLGLDVATWLRGVATTLQTPGA